MRKAFGLFAASLIMAGTALANEVRIGTSADYPPWESLNADNEVVGFDRDVGDEVCRRINATCVWENEDYNGLLPALQGGRFDVVISGLSITAERAEKVDFTIAYADAPSSVAVAARSQYGDIADMAALVASLADRTIGVQAGTTHERVVAAHFQGAILRLYDRPRSYRRRCYCRPYQCRDDGSFGLEPFFKERQGTKLKSLGPLLTSADFPEFGQGQGIAMRKGQDQLRARMNQAISDMLADGTLTKLSKAWFGYDLSAR